MKLLLSRCSDASREIWNEITFYIKHLYYSVYSVIVYAWLKKYTPLKLHLGCGNIHIENWVNIDIVKTPAVDICVDLRRGFPFKRSSVETIYSEHTFEHFSPNEMKSIFYQSHRVLKPGKSLYFNIPDFELLTRSYLLKDTNALDYLKKDLHRFGMNFKNEPAKLADTYYFNNVLHQLGEHKFFYTFALLKSLLQNAGFRKVKQTYYMPHQMKNDIKLRQPYSLFIEAIK